MTIYLEYEALWKLTDPANYLVANFAALKIDSRDALTEEKVQKIAIIARESACYVHAGFGGDSERSHKLLEKLQRLNEKGVVFTVYADRREGRGNISSESLMHRMLDFERMVKSWEST